MDASTSTTFSDEQEQENPSIQGDLLDFVVELLGADSNDNEEVAERNYIAIEEVRHRCTKCSRAKFKSVCSVVANQQHP